MWIVESIPGKHTPEWEERNWASGEQQVISSKTSTRLHVPDSEEQRPRAGKPQKTPCYESRALVKNRELRVQWKADYIRPKRSGDSQLPWTFGRDTTSRRSHSQVSPDSSQPSLTWSTPRWAGKPAGSDAWPSCSRGYCWKEHQAATTTHSIFISYTPRVQSPGMEQKRVKEHFVYPSSVQNTVHNPRRETEMRF